jgi:hypothetical protein
MSPHEKMRKLYASGVITAVTDAHSFRDFSMRNHVSDPMGSYHFSLDFNHPVPTVISMTSPKPASGTLDWDPLPKSSPVFLGDHGLILVGKKNFCKN